MNGKKILFLFYRSPLSYDTGNDRRQHLIYSSVKEQYQAKILTFGNKNSITEEQVIVKLAPSNLKKIFNFLFLLRSPRLTHYYSHKFKETFEETIIKFKPDYIYVEHLFMMQYVLNLNTNAKVIFFNDESNLYVKEKKLKGNFYEKLRNTGLANLEIVACKKADVVLSITDEERQFLQRKGINNVFTIPYGVDTGFYSFSWQKPDENNILFVGDFSHYPNREAAKIIINDILPGLIDFNVKLKIIGRNTNRIKKYIKGQVEIYDNVEDIRPYYCNSTVFVAPIFSGAGMRVKILEATACGIPTIMTSLSNLGIKLVQKKEVFIENSISGILSKIKYLLKNELSEHTLSMRIKARERVVKYFDTKVVTEHIRDIFKEIIYES